IISMAQQARPNVAGQTELLRAHPATCSTVLSRKPLGSFSSRPISVPLQKMRAWFEAHLSPSIPFQAAAPPDVGVRDQNGDDEQHHLDETEPARELVEGHGPRVKEDDL